MSGSQALGGVPLLFLCLSAYGNFLVAIRAAEIAGSGGGRVQNDIDIDITPLGTLGLCDNATLTCRVYLPGIVMWWTFGGTNITNGERYSLDTDIEQGISKLFIACVGLADIGNYTCNLDADVDQDLFTQQSVLLNIEVPSKVTASNGGRARIGNTTTLSCTFSGYPITKIQWYRSDDPAAVELLSVKETRNDTLVHSLLEVKGVARRDNGTYRCETFGPQGIVSHNVPLFVLDVPQVESIDFAIAVGETRIYLRWTVNDWNEPVKKYYIQHIAEGASEWVYYRESIGGGNTSYIIDGLQRSTAYQIRLGAENAIGHGQHAQYKTFVKTLDSDPWFVPEALMKGVTINSITIGWTSPPLEVKPHVHYYQLVLHNDTTKIMVIQPADEMNVYLFQNLRPAASYYFKVSACSEYTDLCGNYSLEANGTTMDGISEAPENVTLHCRYDNISRTSIVSVTWAPPSQPNGHIVRYHIVLEGTATFKNEKGVLEKIQWDPKKKSLDENHLSATFYDVIPPNTNYTIRVSAVTRSRNEGTSSLRYCTMPPTIPDRDKLGRFFWGKVYDQGRWLLKLMLHRVTERNGPICCYRVFLVRLAPQQTVSDLPSPEEFHISTYEEVHQGKKGGAYIAEVFESDSFNSEVLLGDGHTIVVNNTACQHCVGLRPRPPTAPPPTPSPVLTTPEPIVTTDSTEGPPVSFTPEPDSLRVRRSDLSDLLMPHDGTLDLDSNYTGFVEVIVFGVENSLLPAYSGFLPALNPGPMVVNAPYEEPALSAVLQTLFVLIIFVLFLISALCLLRRYTKRVAVEQGVEMTLTNSLRHLCRSFQGRHGVLVSWSPPDMSPLSRADLTAAYMERHKDSDYGFQHEFELLPDRFSDRTTTHSEARENALKNRYPDIRAYDQTRIRLSPFEGVPGSDYINANYVVGYKERKKFICAQGPMDSTVCDFWRMVWEQHLELILMLTNLEEYSKTKCAKYWPDETEGEKIFGEICIRHVREKRYSDYIVRELTMTRSSANRKEEEVRTIVQYHFLVWKDFMAPEHPSGILKFVKRMNEAYSLEKGPILIHCSAGVGRTGTLVALDSLLQQLHDENQVAIFNTICDLRHQRNFLVQSLKQYIFIYRALMEVAQFGDTELSVAELKSAVERLRRRENGRDKCKMEEEFEKICLIVEERKLSSVGGGEENRSKNRNEMVIPYDRNRVILTPVPGREHSTYINASFIEGYDNTESFIITQDPLDTTIADFWRMISEQNIATLVMLSDLGDGPKKCLRYWPDDEAMHDHIRVKYIQSESCPYYTRRELSVTNTKTDETVLVTQYQYNGWPTVEGEVPEVTRGLLELVDQTQGEDIITLGPIVVHCSCGSDRSSMFVALSILVQQLRTEKRVDISTSVRKLRSQRHGMIQTFAQYEFLHRAVVNYADLHHLTDRQTDP